MTEPSLPTRPSTAPSRPLAQFKNKVPDDLFKSLPKFGEKSSTKINQELRKQIVRVKGFVRSFHIVVQKLD